MTGPEYIWRHIRRHSAFFFTGGAATALDRVKVLFPPLRDALALREPCIALPIDVVTTVKPQPPYTVSFGGISITLWNRLPRPDAPGWKSYPDENRPVWYCHNSGTLVPAWNLYGNLLDLLTMNEEREIQKRDRHGRFIAEFSPRVQSGLLEIPAFNEAVAVLVGAALGLAEKTGPRVDLLPVVKPPVIVLSHDCDILLGNDFWTQMARAYRLIEPLRRLRAPRFANIRWIWHNAMNPRDHYFDSVPAMIDLEREYNFTSTFYMLNGSGGRYGARSGSKLLPEVFHQLPEGWDNGMHYNYDTHLEPRRFDAQKRELQEISGHDIRAGRAHYLRLDPDKSFTFWQRHGIAVDESAGYPDRVGYRCGIGGCFPLYDCDTGRELELREIPMVVMDTTLLAQYGAHAISHFEAMLHHLSYIGGAISLNVHTGMFNNPEFAESQNYYRCLLDTCRNLGAVSMTAARLAQAMRKVTPAP